MCNDSTPRRAGPSTRIPRRYHLLFPLAVAALLASGACTSDARDTTLTGPEPDPDPDPGPPEPESVPSSMSLTSPQDTVALGTDTVQLDVVIRDQDGERMNLDSVNVQLEVEDEGVLTMLDGHRVIAEPDTVFFSGDHPDGAYVPLNERGTKPDSKDPIPTTIHGSVEGHDVSASVDLVQNSPTWWVNLTPDGTCMAVGFYTTGERIHTDLTVWARDFTGRRVRLEPGDITWEAADPEIINYEILENDFRTAKVWGLEDGKTTMNATVNDITDKSEILSSEETDEHGNVSCGHLQ